MNLERSHPPPPWTSVTSFTKWDGWTRIRGLKTLFKEGLVVFVVVVFPRWIFARKTIYKTDKIEANLLEATGVQSLNTAAFPEHNLENTEIVILWALKGLEVHQPCSISKHRFEVNGLDSWHCVSSETQPADKLSRTVFCSRSKDVKWHWLTINTNRCNIQLHSASMINLRVKVSLFWKMVCLPGLPPRPTPGSSSLWVPQSSDDTQ